MENHHVQWENPLYLLLEGNGYNMVVVWVKYADLTGATIVYLRGMIPKWPEFRLVKSYNLARYEWL